MGTRYNITKADIKKMGMVVELKEDGLYHVAGGIAGWDFSSFGGKDFSGPNVFKPELDIVFREKDISPEYY